MVGKRGHRSFSSPCNKITCPDTVLLDLDRSFGRTAEEAAILKASHHLPVRKNHLDNAMLKKKHLFAGGTNTYDAFAGHNDGIDSLREEQPKRGRKKCI